MYNLYIIIYDYIWLYISIDRLSSAFPYFPVFPLAFPYLFPMYSHMLSLVVGFIQIDQTVSSKSNITVGVMEFRNK